MTGVPDVLATRYASPAMRAIWSPHARAVAERRLWVTVLEAQHAAGVEVDPEVLDAYRAAVEDVDLEAIAERERRLRHDVKARIEEFNAAASRHLEGRTPQHIHTAMTSRDVTDNVEQHQIRRSLELVRDRAVAALARLAERATEHELTVVAGRTHNVVAQPTTVGKRFAHAGRELLVATHGLENLLDRYPLRGLKGPVGTQADQLDLLDEDRERLAAVERAVAEHLGFGAVLDCVGQVYPRSLDLEVAARLVQVASGPANLATTLRLMAGQEQVTEGFAAGQVGSSAMPHKMNPRSCERISGLVTVLSGFLAMTSGLVGDQWNEGDVSDSVVRRVALPGAFFAADGLFATLLTVLDELSVHTAAIAAELRRQLPFLATPRLLVAAVRAGLGREEAHRIVGEHAAHVVREMRSEGRVDNDLLARLAADERFPLDARQLDELVSEPRELVGATSDQIRAFAAAVRPLVDAHPEAATYVPGPIL